MEGDEEAAAEGEAKMEEGMAAAMALFTAESFGEFGGATDIPKLLTALMMLYPVFGDKVKSEVMFYELGGDSGSDSFAAVAAVTGAYVNAGEKAEADSFGGAWLSAEDLEELTEVSKSEGKSALVFPGVVAAFAEEADALGQMAKVEGKKKVLFKFKGKVLKPAGDKVNVFCRQFAKVESLAEPAEGVEHYVCTLSDFSEFVFATVKEYSEKVAAVAAAAGAVKDAVEAKVDEAADKMGEDKPA